jgi:hypothetical protein
VHLVELLGLGLGQADAALGDDAQARAFDQGVDLAGQVPLGGVRLQDREGAFSNGFSGLPDRVGRRGL